MDGDLTCAWMDRNYDWNNPNFTNQTTESLNLAVNYVTDVLHTLAVESAQPPPTEPIPLWNIEAAIIIIAILATGVIIFAKRKPHT